MVTAEMVTDTSTDATEWMLYKQEGNDHFKKNNIEVRSLLVYLPLFELSNDRWRIHKVVIFLSYLLLCISYLLLCIFSLSGEAIFRYTSYCGDIILNNLWSFQNRSPDCS